MIVMKFGGSSVAGAEKSARVAGIWRGRLARKPVLVVSAFRGTTDDLLALAKEALTGNLSRFAPVAQRYRETAVERGVAAAPLEPLLQELVELARGVSLLHELTPRT